jgi:hypothetical protein
LPYTFVCQRYANACGLVRTLTDVISHSYAGFRLTYGVPNLTRNEQVSGSSALVGSRFGLDKPNTQYSW